MSKGLHPRNKHAGFYDFQQLTKICPDLNSFVRKSPRGEPTLDFSDPDAVKTLNRALLNDYYGISKWDIPSGYLCPPIPGRADYLHSIADLLASCHGGVIPRGESIRVLDIGVGASCIYPLIGHHEYGWKFVGSECDLKAFASAKKNILENDNLTEAIELRLQPSSTNILKGIILQAEVFQLSMCNPPFHASLAEAQEGSRRKWKNLGKRLNHSTSTNHSKSSQSPRLNFGGQGTELWCPGGEVAFVRKMIDESVDYSENVFWFSTLISKEANLPVIYAALKKAGVAERRTLEMAQGQKKSRVVAWTFRAGSTNLKKRPDR